MDIILNPWVGLHRNRPMHLVSLRDSPGAANGRRNAGFAKSKVEESAAILEIPIGTAQSRLNYVVTTLRRHLISVRKPA
jgi:hypothetical protein